MAANGSAQAGKSYPAGHWGKWRGVTCAECDQPARCAGLGGEGLCMSHYNKQRWNGGVRSPSVNPASGRAAHLRHRYGIDVAEYDRIFTEQGGVCAICADPPGGGRSKPHHTGLCIDHDHDTGRIRGLLCDSCNIALGYLRTSEALLTAVEYLQRQL